MSDDTIRQLERAAAASLAPADMARLKAAWARSLVWRECLEPGCGAHVPDLAWSRHSYKHEYAKAVIDRRLPGTRDLQESTQRALDSAPSTEAAPVPSPPRVGSGRATSGRTGGGMRVVPIPLGSPIGARPRKSPLWHRLVVQPGQNVARFFWDAGGQIGRPFPSTGHRGSLPAGTMFYAYGMSLLPDPGATLEQVLPVYTTGELQLVFSTSVMLSPAARLAAPHGANRACFLADEVMRDPTAQTDDETSALLEGKTPMLSLTISGRPLEIVQQESFSLDLIMPDSPPAPTGFMAVLHGISLWSLTS